MKVEEPSEDKAILMVRGVASILEKHHRVQVLDAALEAAVRLSHRYIPGRQLPDKAISLLDTACARVAISQHGVPPQLEDCRRTIEGLQTELEIIGREETVGINAAERRKAAEEKLAASEVLRESLEQRWNSERELVERVLGIRAKLRKGSEPVEGTGSKLEQAAEAQKAAADAPAVETVTPEERQRLLGELSDLQARLADLQGESPLILPSVDEVAVDPSSRLDRSAGRPHGEERDRDGPQSGAVAEPAHGRAAPRARHDRAAYPHVPREAG